MYNTANIAAARGFNEKHLPIGVNYKTMRQFFNEAKEGKYKAFIKVQGNPVHNSPNRGRWEKDTFPHMELIVDFDVWMTDTGELADYVLPDCMPFEREELISIGAYGHVVLQEPAIEPVGENRTANYFFSGLAKRMGLGEFFQKTDEEWLEQMLAESPALVNADGSHITIEQLHREKLVRPAVFPPVKYNAALVQPEFATPTGRMEFYADYYANLDEALPKYRPSIEFPIPEGAKYPYQFFTGRQRFFMQSMFTDDPVMRELSGGKPLCRMNPLDAEKEGLVVGDYIEVYNDRGSVRLSLVLDEAVPPGTVHVWFGWRKRAYDYGTYAELTVPCGGNEACDELSDQWWDRLVSQGKAPGMGTEAALAGTWDTLWDATCAVRKVEE